MPNLLSALLAPSADRLETAVEELSGIQRALMSPSYSSEQIQDLQGLLAALDPLARQARQFYGALLEVSTPPDEGPNSQVNLCG